MKNREQIQQIANSVLGLWEAEDELRKAFGPNLERSKMVLKLLALASASIALRGGRGMVVSTTVLEAEGDILDVSYYSLLEVKIKFWNPEQEPVLIFPFPIATEAVGELNDYLQDVLAWELVSEDNRERDDIIYPPRPQDSRAVAEYIHAAQRFVKAADFLLDVAQENVPSRYDYELELLRDLAIQLADQLQPQGALLDKFFDKNGPSFDQLIVAASAAHWQKPGSQLVAAALVSQGEHESDFVEVLRPPYENEDSFLVTAISVPMDEVGTLAEFKKYVLMRMADGLIGL